MGNGSPTAPRPSEIDQVAAEEAAKAAANASIACIANTAAAMQGKSRGSEAVEGLPVAAAAAAQEMADQTAARECDAAVDINARSGGSNQQDDLMVMMFANSSRAQAGERDEASGSTSCSIERGRASF